MTPISHPPTLVLGDIHHRTSAADRAITKFSERCSHVVLLGDFFDDFGDSPETMRATCRWLRTSLEDPNRTHLLGNHDAAYLLPYDPQTVCPGWTGEKQRIFDLEMAGADRTRFQVATQVGPWLLSHAGFNLELVEQWGTLGLPARAQTEWDKAGRQERTPLLDIGRSRGGRSGRGGVLWMDWNNEFRPHSGLNQVVGHTPSRGVARAKCLTAAGTHRALELQKPSANLPLLRLPQPGPEFSSVNWCLDTVMTLAGTIEDGRMEIVAI